MRPSLGVLITYHNEGALLTACLDGLLAGPDRPDEILIYDDASADPAERYVKKEHPVRIIRGSQNVGIGLARNALMRASESDFIHFQDSDDFFKPEWCHKIRRTTEGGADIILNNISYVNTVTQREQINLTCPFYELSAKDDLLAFFLSKVRRVMVCMVTFRRKHGLSIGGYLPREVIDVSEDIEFFARLFALGLPYKVVDEQLVIKNTRPDTLSMDSDMKVRREIRLSHLKVSRLMQSWLPSSYHPYLASYLLDSALKLVKSGEFEEAGRCLKAIDALGVGKQVEGSADTYWKIGAHLFRLGERPLAKQAFRSAHRLGPASFGESPRPYRWLAAVFGPECAERCSLLYRHVAPKKLRLWIRETAG